MLSPPAAPGDRPCVRCGVGHSRRPNAKYCSLACCEASEGRGRYTFQGDWVSVLKKEARVRRLSTKALMREIMSAVVRDKLIDAILDR